MPKTSSFRQFSDFTAHRSAYLRDIDIIKFFVKCFVKTVKHATVKIHWHS